MTQTKATDAGLTEPRLFDPPAAHEVGADRWLIDDEATYRAMHAASINDPEAFYGEAATELHWFSPWSSVVEFTSPDAVWFKNATTNLCFNCVDRHVESGHGADIGLIWEGEPIGSNASGDGPEIRALSYADLQQQTARFANVLLSMGVKKGDVVTIYMGMVPELAIACLACARIGAIHSVIFGGFASHSIVDRVRDANSRIIVTCDGAWRRGSVVPLKTNVDEAIESLGDAVEKVVCLKRTGNEVAWDDARDIWWHDAVNNASADCPCAELDSEATAFLLYTSGSTGKPKGIEHTVGGYMVHTYLTSKYVFNMIPGLDEPKREAPLPNGQVYWCTADIGWITGHSYIMYGVMANRVPTLMYEGAPNFPEADRFWDIVERHKVTQFYTAPTAIRAFMKWGVEEVAKHDLSSLQVLGSVGEPINPEAWMWYRTHIGRGVCPIVDTWWQTETGGHMLTTLPGAHRTKPGSCGLPFFGVDTAICEEDGTEIKEGSGLLTVRSPWPSMLRGIYGDRERFIETYWNTFDVDGTVSAGKPSPYYLAGDGAQRDADGYFWITGRIDDVINVSGHRMGTAEVESSLVAHPAVVEAAVVGMPHEIKGTGIAAFITLSPASAPADNDEAEALKKALRAHVGEQIGAIAKPDLIRFTDTLPKTRSGKIMRRLLRDIAAERETTQDTTTLEDNSVLAKLRGEDKI